MKKRNDARRRLTVSMVIFGTLGPFVRAIDLSSAQIALCRALLALVLIGGFLAVKGQRLLPRGLGKELFWLSVSGAAVGVNWILLFEAYRYTSVSVATLSYYFAPVLVTLVSPLLFREKLTKKQLLCFFGSTLGLVLITWAGGSGANDGLGIAFGLGAALFYASVMLINKRIQNVQGLHRAFFQFLAAVAVLGVYVAFTGGLPLQNMTPWGWGSLLTVGLVHTGLAYCLYFGALKELPGQKAAILSYIDPLVAVVISVTVLGEPLGLRQVLGGALILGFTLYNEISPRPKA